jgi:hypothetical protein
MRYRIYALGPGGEIVSGADLSVSNDSEALHEAAEHANLHGIEIWQGNRQVVLISAPSTQLVRSAMGPGRTHHVLASSALELSKSGRLPQLPEPSPAGFSKQPYLKARSCGFH